MITRRSFVQTSAVAALLPHGCGQTQYSRYISILGSNTLFHHPADVWPDAVDLNKTTGWVNTFVQLGIELAGARLGTRVPQTNRYAVL